MAKEYKPKTGITLKGAKELFAVLVAELEKAGNLNDRTILLVDNMVLLEQLKLRHQEDIRKRGAVELFKNGTQEMHRQNPSVAAIVKIVEQQRKLQAELKLTPSSAKTPAGPPGGGENGEGDEFEAY